MTGPADARRGRDGQAGGPTCAPVCWRWQAPITATGQRAGDAGRAGARGAAPDRGVARAAGRPHRHGDRRLDPPGRRRLADAATTSPTPIPASTPGPTSCGLRSSVATSQWPAPCSNRSWARTAGGSSSSPDSLFPPGDDRVVVVHVRRAPRRGPRLVDVLPGLGRPPVADVVVAGVRPRADIASTEGALMALETIRSVTPQNLLGLPAAVVRPACRPTTPAGSPWEPSSRRGASATWPRSQPRRHSRRWSARSRRSTRSPRCRWRRWVASGGRWLGRRGPARRRRSAPSPTVAVHAERDDAGLWTKHGGPAWISNNELFESITPRGAAPWRGARAAGRLSVLDVGCGPGSLSGVIVGRGDARGRHRHRRDDGRGHALTSCRGRRSRWPTPRPMTSADSPRRRVRRRRVALRRDVLRRPGSRRLTTSAARSGRRVGWRSSVGGPRTKPDAFTLGTNLLLDRLPRRPGSAPGAARKAMAFADPDVLRAILDEAGWSDIAIEPFDGVCDYGTDDSDGVERRVRMILSRPVRPSGPGLAPPDPWRAEVERPHRRRAGRGFARRSSTGEVRIPRPHLARHSGEPVGVTGTSASRQMAWRMRDLASRNADRRWCIVLATHSGRSWTSPRVLVDPESLVDQLVAPLGVLLTFPIGRVALPSGHLDDDAEGFVDEVDPADEPVWSHHPMLRGQSRS